MSRILMFAFALLVFSCKRKDKPEIQFPEGGYPYSKNLNAQQEQFYFDPVKAEISKKDSVLIASDCPQLFQAFDEPNISISPPANPIIRMIFFTGRLGYEAFVTMTEAEIIAKETKSGYAMTYSDETKLDSLERRHFYLLRKCFPFNEYDGDVRTKRYLDSLIRVFPKLNESAYYVKLRRRAKGVSKEPFSYRSWKVPISKEIYDSIVGLINKSGFWKLPYINYECDEGAMDGGDSYILEVATPKKYQVVNHAKCYHNSTPLDKACKALIKASKVDESFKRYEDKIKEKF
jgi:hypothetical protein